MYRSTCQFDWRTLLLVAAAIACSQASDAQMTGLPNLVCRMPERPNSVSTSSGLSLELTDDGLGDGQYGYRRFLVHVQSPKPVAADTQITVRIMAGFTPSMTAEADGVLRAGEIKTTVEVQMPQYLEWDVLTWDVWIDGVRDRQLSRGRDNWQPMADHGTNRWQNGMMTELRLGLGKSDLFTVIPNQQRSVLGDNSLTVMGGWSDDWLDYTPFDVVSTEFPVLLLAEMQIPKDIAALRQWVQAGGVLWIESVGDDWQALRRLDSMLGWETPEGAIEPYEPSAQRLLGVDGWSYVSLRRRWRDDPNGPNPSAIDGSQNGNPFIPQVDNTPRFSTDWFVVRRCGWGMVAAYRGNADQLGPSSTRRDQFSAARFWRTHDWTRRHGLVPGQANDDFSKWLIPGVGLAPVVSFQVLITLFVIAIGPANYWLLKRAGRLHLMVLTVPAAAFGITALLLAYGLFSDGFSTRLRAQTITRLDQKRDEATTWSRLSYYAAFAPRNGLTFSDQTAIYPILANTPGSYRNAGDGERYEIEWADNDQHLVRGWLASRTPTQYLTIEPRSTKAELLLKLDTPQPTVTNKFASEAQLIIVIDENGKFLLGKEVGVDSPQPLKEVKRSAAVTALREVLSDREPRNPDGFDTIDESSLLSGRSNYTRQAYPTPGGGTELDSMNGSLLDDEWQTLLGLNGGAPLSLSPRSYVVVSDLALLPVSTNDFAVEDSSVHIVIGSW